MVFKISDFLRTEHLKDTSPVSCTNVFGVRMCVSICMNVLLSAFLNSLFIVPEWNFAKKRKTDKQKTKTFPGSCYKCTHFWDRNDCSHWQSNIHRNLWKYKIPGIFSRMSFMFFGGFSWMSAGPRSSCVCGQWAHLNSSFGDSQLQPLSTTSWVFPSPLTINAATPILLLSCKNQCFMTFLYEHCLL